MIHLNSAPAFGFEWDRCHAGLSRAMLGRINMNKTLGKVAYWSANFFKLLGIICPIVGAIRMIEALCADDANKTMHFLRGLGELLGCGIFILGIDIAVTAHRATQIPPRLMIFL